VKSQIRRSSGSLVSASLLLLAACSDNRANRTEEVASLLPQRGGQATVLLGSEYAGSWPVGLDPATNTTGGANLSLMNAIYGGLFQLTTDEQGDNPKIAGILATHYEISNDGQTIVIFLRQNVTFSDGTPFNAHAVRFNIERSLGSPCTCAPRDWPWAEHAPVTTRDDHTIELHLARPYPALMNAIPGSNINWIASPSALEKMGEDQFKITPVGAGPFRVVSNQLSSKLVLERNPLYWQENRPYLDRLVFQSISSEQTAYQALLAGDAHAYEGMASTQLIKQAESNERITVTRQPATSPYVVQLNTTAAPFNDQRAREAIYYATNVDAIRKGLFNDWYPASQSFTASGGLFHEEEISGYRAYDVARARSLVAEIGGMRVKLATLRSVLAEQVITALQSQWREAGIEVSIETYELGQLIQEFQSGEWIAMLQTAGAYDPEAGVGVSFRFRSGRPFSGVHDAELDRMLSAAAGAINPHERANLYSEAGKYISDNAYAPFLFAFAPAQITTGGIYGPGLTTRIPPILVNTAILWQDVWMTAE
jgi:peptide/nickel transport system substrate-binding protein